MTDAENVSKERVEAAARCIAGEWWSNDPIVANSYRRQAISVLTADAPYAASRYADGVREGLRMAREELAKHGFGIKQVRDIFDLIDARIKEGE